MLFVILGWVLFRAPDFATAGAMFAGMAGFNGLLGAAEWPAVLAVAAMVSLLGPTTKEFVERPAEAASSLWHRLRSRRRHGGARSRRGPAEKLHLLPVLMVTRMMSWQRFLLSFALSFGALFSAAVAFIFLDESLRQFASVAVQRTRHHG